MSLQDMADDDAQTQEPDDPSVSYLYIYEEGREDMDNWDEEDQDTMAQAYHVCSGGGVVRNTFDNTSAYENIHHAAGDLMVGIADVFTDGDYSRLMEFVGPDVDAVGQYLDENPEVRDELIERLQEHESQQ